MSSFAPYGKRKKSLDGCPNPLFIQWLTEWRDDTAAKGLKSQYTYAKALRSLQKYPLPFGSGKECKILENFGDKICQMLDEKLDEYVIEYGTTEPVEGYLTVPAVKKAYTKKRKKKANEESPIDTLHIPAPPPRRAAGFVSLDSGSEGEACGAAVAPAPRKRRQSSGPREYMPKYRSGAYALLITLFRDKQNVGTQGYMSKRELMREAQSFADASFTIPDPGSRYTAWSSMGTLIKKGLIIKEGNPAKYKLTDAGDALSLKVEQMEAPTGEAESQLGFVLGLARNNMEPNQHTGWNQNPDTYSKPKLPTMNHDSSNTRRPVASSLDGVNTLGQPARSSGTRDKPYASSYSSESDGDDLPDMPLSQPQRATVRQVHTDKTAPSSLSRTHIHAISDDSDDDLPSLSSRMAGTVKVATKRQALPLKQPSVPSVSSAGASGVDAECRFRFQYVDDADREVSSKDQAVVSIEDDGTVGFLIKCKYEDLLLSGKNYKLDSSRRSCGDFVHAYLNNEDAPERAPLPQCNSGQKPVAKPLPASGSHRTAPPNGPTKQKSSITNTLPKGLAPQMKQIASWQDSADTQSSQSSTSSVKSTASSLPEPDFILSPGTFDIVLIIDKCEHYGGSAIGKQILLPELRKQGVEFDVRAVNVGDFLWVARPKGSKDASRELVLDYVVERKRMDDLAGSIIDGRFREQKFRLRNCGASQPIYLVEDYGSMQHFSIPEDSLRQAIINTQVIDNFYVKRTRDMKDSISYLALMTRFIQSAYMSKTLVACNKKALEEVEFTNNIRDCEQRLLTYAEFNKASLKTKVLTVREMFGKQMVQLAGFTPEKVCAVLQMYPTPNSLLWAYERCLTEKERESLLADIKFGTLKKNVGIAISRQVFMLYNKTSSFT